MNTKNTKCCNSNHADNFPTLFYVYFCYCALVTQISEIYYYFFYCVQKNKAHRTCNYKIENFESHSLRLTVRELNMRMFSLQVCTDLDLRSTDLLARLLGY